MNENPFARATDIAISPGAVAIESDRAIAEAQGRLILAKRFPRNRARAYDEIIEECKRLSLAEEALYSFPRAGQPVEGPSIRLAEVLARCWGNIDFGLRELSRREGESELEAFAVDLETNTRSLQQFTVRHFRDTRKGKQALTDERDIYEIGANLGARRLRARILAIIPGDVIDAAVAQCRKTLEGKSDIPMADKVRKLIDAFRPLSVTIEMLETRIGHALDQMTPKDYADLYGVHRSMKDGLSSIDDWFGKTPTDNTPTLNDQPTGPDAPAIVVTPLEAKLVQGFARVQGKADQSVYLATRTELETALKEQEGMDNPPLDLEAVARLNTARQEAHKRMVGK